MHELDALKTTTILSWAVAVEISGEGTHVQQATTPNSKLLYDESEQNQEKMLGLWVVYITQMCPSCMNCMYNWLVVTELRSQYEPEHIRRLCDRSHCILITMSSLCIYILL